MKTRKMTAAALAAVAIFGAPLFAPCEPGLRMAEAAPASRDVDRTPYLSNAEIDPYGRGAFHPLPAILRERRETVETVRWKMPWSGFGCFHSPGELEHLFSILGDEAEEEEAKALAGNSMAIYTSRYVQRMDGLVASILESRAAYQGGHRGRYGVKGRNFNSRRGEELAIDDVFEDTGALPGLIAERLRADYPGVAFRDNLEDWLSEKVAEGHLEWTLFARGATFYFTPRSIVPTADTYAAGQMIYTATIFYSEAPELFIEPYNFGAAAWSFEVEQFMPVRVPLGDGSTAMLQVGGLKIRLGDHEFIEEGAMRYQRFTFVSLMDGRRYLYADVAPDDATLPHELRVYQLSADGVERLPGSRPLTTLASPPDDDEDRLILPMISPGNFCLCEAVAPGEEPTEPFRWMKIIDVIRSDHKQLFAEEEARARYHVGSDGWPEEGSMGGY